jgi:hypothetical protein
MTTIATTPRNAITAALFLGDDETARYCPSGLSSTYGHNLAALIAAAAAQGCDFDA